MWNLRNIAAACGAFAKAVARVCMISFSLALCLSLGRIEEVPPATFTPPRDAEEAAEFQAMGAMLIRRSSRMDLIDGAYNRYAFNDDHLPEWCDTDSP